MMWWWRLRRRSCRGDGKRLKAGCGLPRNEDILCRILSYLTLRELGMLEKRWPERFLRAGRRVERSEVDLWRVEVEASLPGLGAFLEASQRVPPAAWRALHGALLVEDRRRLVRPSRCVSGWSEGAETAATRVAWWNEGVVLLVVSAIDARTTKATPLLALGWSLQLCLQRGVGGRRTPSYLFRADRFDLTALDTLLELDSSLVDVVARIFCVHPASGAAALLAEKRATLVRDDDDDLGDTPRLARLLTGLRLSFPTTDRPARDWLGLEMRPKRRASEAATAPPVADFGFKLVWLFEPAPHQLLDVACVNMPLGRRYHDHLRRTADEMRSRRVVARVLGDAVDAVAARRETPPITRYRGYATARTLPLARPKNNIKWTARRGSIDWHFARSRAREHRTDDVSGGGSHHDEDSTTALSLSSFSSSLTAPLRSRSYRGPDLLDRNLSNSSASAVDT